MRLRRFDNDRLGLVEGDEVRDNTAVLDVLPDQGRATRNTQTRNFTINCQRCAANLPHLTRDD